MLLLAAVDPWAFSPHPEVWVLVGGLAVLYGYAVTRIGPKAVAPGSRAVNRTQLVWFAAALVVLWIASDWPLHDIAERHLYSAHMFQHLLLALVLPPLALWATPEWLARLVVGSGRGYRVLRRLTLPIAAAVIFNGMAVLTHWPTLVNASVQNGPLHYGVHLAVVASAFIMWMPVCGPLPELRISLPSQMIYLFLHSVIPTVPAGWLTFADGAVYSAYDHAQRGFALSVTHDQQVAGLIMKLGAGALLWTIITVLFFRWAGRFADDDHAGAVTDLPPAGRPWLAADDLDDDRDAAGRLLTWDEVEAELRAAPPPPRHPADS